ncbi:hypothetical protein F2Q69_00021025 [Brassica cretica]|uniref:Transposase-associated domain-containing protein n=1 Tax=Brassica cretica TaxID=69181 RepID=A0A8S9QFQ1_BRACR|nr:hypothetical protein F2Q69_00021025 [Brassica cretica]
MSSSNYFRSWIDRSHLDPNTRLLTEEYQRGITEFMGLVHRQPEAKTGMLRCPCSNCKNRKVIKEWDVWTHLYLSGFTRSYKIWYHHGETDYEHGSTSEPQPAVCYIKYPRVRNRDDPWVTVTRLNPRGRVQGSSELEDPLQPSTSGNLSAAEDLAGVGLVVDLTDFGEEAIVHVEDEPVEPDLLPHFSLPLSAELSFSLTLSAEALLLSRDFRPNPPQFHTLIMYEPYPTLLGKGVFKHNLGAQSIATQGDRMAEENDGEPVDDLALMKRAYTNKKTGQIDDGLVGEVVTLVQTQVQDEVSQLQTDDDDSTASTNLSRFRINEIVESSVPKKKGRLVGLSRRPRSVPPSSASPPFVDPEVLTAQLKDNDDRISLLETQMAAQQAGYEAQKRLNQQMMEMIQRMYPNEVFPNVQDP